MALLGRIGLLVLLISIAFKDAKAQIPVPAEMQKRNMTYTIFGGTVHLGNGNVIKQGTVEFADGKIIAVFEGSPDDPNNPNKVLINAHGKHVYPGFIALNSKLGLFEIAAVRATRDFREIGTFNPNVRSAIAYNAESKVIPTVRSNGILLAQCTPSGGLISGRSSVMQLDAWNWEDAIVKEDDGIHLHWVGTRISRNSESEKNNKDHAEADRKKMEELKAFFAEAKAYCAGDQSKSDIKLESMCSLFDGSAALYIYSSQARDFLAAVDYAKKMGVKRIAVVNPKDVLLIQEQLKAMNVAVILKRLHSLPDHEDSDIDQYYKLPALLDKSGLLYSMNYTGRMDAMGTRNLPFAIGTAVAYGLDYEKAVQVISLNAAKILGIDKEYGSIEPGKSATLFISTGDALDMRTNNVEMAFIDGRKLDLDDHQKKLYRKFKSKYDRASDKQIK